MNRRSFLRSTGVAAGAGGLYAANATPAEASDLNPHRDAFDEAHSSNFTSASRTASDIKWIVVHATEGTYGSAINWFNNPDANVSAHYVISNYDHTWGEPGHCTQMVRHSDIGWHAKGSNSHSIGIEHEWHWNQGRYFTDECYQKSAQLIEWLADTYNIPLEWYDHPSAMCENDGGIITHRHAPQSYTGAGHCGTLTDKTCPGPDFDENKLFSYIDGSSGGGGGGGIVDEFDEGDRVVTTAESLNGRDAPTLDSNVIQTLPEGSVGDVVGGPEYADTITWWQVWFPVYGTTVWCSGNFLEASDMPDPEHDDPENFTVETNLNRRLNATGAEIDAAIEALSPDSPLIGLGDTIVDVQNAFTVDALYILAHAVHESAWGKSQIAQDHNNLFGWGASDDDPYGGAARFDSFEQCVWEVIEQVKELYLTPGDWRYNGPHLAGMNVYYATDPEWDVKTADHYRNLAAQIDNLQVVDEDGGATDPDPELDIADFSEGDRVETVASSTAWTGDETLSLAAGETGEISPNEHLVEDDTVYWSVILEEHGWWWVDQEALSTSTDDGSTPDVEQYFRGFDRSSDEIGQSPSDVVDTFSGGLTHWVAGRTRRDIEGSQRCLRLQKSGTGKDGVLLNEISDIENVELFCAWRSQVDSGYSNRLKLLSYAQGDTGVLGGHSQSDRARLTQYDPSFSELDSSGSTFSAGDVVAQRLRVVDGEASVKVWKWGSREPRAWQINSVPVDVALSGGIGLFTWGSNNADTDIVVWEVGATEYESEYDYAPPRDPELDFMSYPEEITHPLPVNDGDVWYPDGWDENRDGGNRVHRAVDAYENWPHPEKGMPVFAARGGTIRSWMAGHPDSSGGTPITPGSGGGYQIHIDSHDGRFRYCYLHLGDDEQDAHESAFAPHPTEDRTLAPGDTVERGQHIGWLGDSGITGSGPHLHFEIRDLSGELSDPQPSDFDDVGNASGPRYDPYPAMLDAERRGDVVSLGESEEPVQGTDPTILDYSPGDRVETSTSTTAWNGDDELWLPSGETGEISTNEYRVEDDDAVYWSVILDDHGWWWVAQDALQREQDDTDGGVHKFEVGEQVSTTTNLNGRASWGLDTDVVQVLSEGTTGEVINGPEYADDITWWGLHVPGYDINVWCSEYFLESTTGGNWRFDEGDTVETTAYWLNGRSAPSLDSSVVQELPEGTTGSVVSAPEYADGVTWWQLWVPEYDVTVWCSGNYLEAGEGSVSDPIDDGGTFSMGEGVVTTANYLNGRRRPHLGSDVLRVLPEGTYGEVMNGPQVSDDITWWGLYVPAYDVYVWCSEVYLASTGSGGSTGGKFDHGDQVVSTAYYLSGRRKPGLDTEVVYELPEGTTGTVVNGPAEADGVTWWQLHVEHQGTCCTSTEYWVWCSENYLEEDTSSGSGFQMGQSVYTTADLNGRYRPYLDSDVVQVLPEGTTGEIMNGPTESDGITWWGLYVPEYDEWVWCSGNYLASF